MAWTLYLRPSSHKIVISRVLAVGLKFKIKYRSVVGCLLSLDGPKIYSSLISDYNGLKAH